MGGKRTDHGRLHHEQGKTETSVIREARSAKPMTKANGTNDPPSELGGKRKQSGLETKKDDELGGKRRQNNARALVRPQHGGEG